MILSRRQILLGAASSALLPSLVPSLSRAQDDFRIIEARPGKLRLAEGTETDILGCDGQAPGPLLRLKRGEELRLRLVNKLAAPTSLHFRGMRGPNALDGVAPLTQKAVAPGGAFDYRFTPPDAGVFLYHAHADANFAEQSARGLHGLLIVDEPDAPEYDHEVIATIGDWKLDAGAQLTACSTTKGREAFGSIEEAGGAGRIGSLVTINGKPAPQNHAFAPGARVYLRLAAATTARLMALTFEGAQPMITAIDGQNCDEFEPVKRSIPVGPGSRFDILFDMPDEGQEMKVILRGGALGVAGEADRAIITFTAKGAKAKPRAPIKSAPLNPLVRPVIPLQNAKRLDLIIERTPAPRNATCITPDMALWRLNGKTPRASDPPLFSVKRGTPVTLGFINQSNVAHVMRLYGHVMRQLHLLDDGWEPYWRDSVIIAPGRTVRIAFVADNPGRWRLGSGILDHAVTGLAAWFEVT